MKTCFLFFLFLSHLSKTFASPTNEVVLGGEGGEGRVAVHMTAQSLKNRNGYECGDVFFDDYEVKSVLMIGLSSVFHKYDVQEYHGPLYRDSETSQYFLYPIKKGKFIRPTAKYNQGVNFVVFKRDGTTAIDLIARISSYHYTKCIRIDSSQVRQLAPDFDKTNGYQCGHDFLSDEKIQKSVLFAKTKIGEKTKYPAPYVGKLYPENSGYMIWPILFRDKLYSSGTGNGGPFFLLINREGDLIEVVVKGFFNNFLRCARSREIPKAPESDPQSRLFVPAPRAGFQCGRIFFDDQALDRAAGTAKTVAFYKYYKQFPAEYSGPPFNEPCLLWPIFSDGKLYRKGRGGPYRVVLSPDYRVINAIIVNKDNKISVCEKAVIKGKKNHDPSDYFCDGQYFPNQQLVSTAEIGCEKLNIGSIGNKRLYPARYKGPNFEQEGPYLTYPLYMKASVVRSKRINPGRFRVVMNHACEVVGAIYTPRGEGSYKNFFKCSKVNEDGSVNESLADTNDRISEHKTIY